MERRQICDDEAWRWLYPSADSKPWNHAIQLPVDSRCTKQGNIKDSGVAECIRVLGCSQHRIRMVAISILWRVHRSNQALFCWWQPGVCFREGSCTTCSLDISGDWLETASPAYALCYWRAMATAAFTQRHWKKGLYHDMWLPFCYRGQQDFLSNLS